MSNALRYLSWCEAEDALRHTRKVVCSQTAGLAKDSELSAALASRMVEISYFITTHLQCHTFSLLL